MNVLVHKMLLIEVGAFNMRIKCNQGKKSCMETKLIFMNMSENSKKRGVYE